MTLEYFLLFLFALDFLNNSGYIFLTLFLYVLCKYLIHDKRLTLNPEFIMIILFSFSYFVMYSINFSISYQSIIYYLVGPIGSYLIGRSLISKWNINKSLYKIIMIIVIGLFIHGSLNMYIKISLGTLRFPSEYLIDFWRNKPISRTLQGLYLTPISCTMFVSIFIKDKINSKYTRLFLLFGSIFALWSTFMLANRTLIIISIMIFSISMMLLLKENKKHFTSRFFKIIVFIILIVLLFIFDVFSIKTFIFNSPLFNRLNNLNMAMLETSRYERYITFLKNFIYYPLGGKKMPIYGGNSTYVHNVWLDIYVDVGVLPFVFFVFYTMFMLRSFIKFINIKQSIFLKYFALAIYGGFLLTFFVEPVIEANPYYIMMFFIINGSVSEYVLQVNKSSN